MLADGFGTGCRTVTPFIPFCLVCELEEFFEGVALGTVPGLGTPFDVVVEVFDFDLALLAEPVCVGEGTGVVDPDASEAVTAAVVAVTEEPA